MVETFGDPVVEREVAAAVYGSMMQRGGLQTFPAGGGTYGVARLGEASQQLRFVPVESAVMPSTSPPEPPALHKPQDPWATTSTASSSSSSSSSAASSTLSPYPVLRQPLRKGKWTAAEEAYVSQIIADFNKGLLPLPAGTTLRGYLSEKLNCDPMRITKKFAGAACIGKRIFQPCEHTVGTAVEMERAKKELESLEKRFQESLQEGRLRRIPLLYTTPANYHRTREEERRDLMAHFRGGGGSSQQSGLPTLSAFDHQQLDYPWMQARAGGGYDASRPPYYLGLSPASRYAVPQSFGSTNGLPSSSSTGASLSNALYPRRQQHDAYAPQEQEGRKADECGGGPALPRSKSSDQLSDSRQLNGRAPGLIGMPASARMPVISGKEYSLLLSEAERREWGAGVYSPPCKDARGVGEQDRKGGCGCSGGSAGRGDGKGEGGSSSCRSGVCGGQGLSSTRGGWGGRGGQEEEEEEKLRSPLMEDRLGGHPSSSLRDWRRERDQGTAVGGGRGGGRGGAASPADESVDGGLGKGGSLSSVASDDQDAGELLLDFLNSVRRQHNEVGAATEQQKKPAAAGGDAEERRGGGRGAQQQKRTLHGPYHDGGESDEDEDEDAEHANGPARGGKRARAHP